MLALAEPGRPAQAHSHGTRIDSKPNQGDLRQLCGCLHGTAAIQQADRASESAWLGAGTPEQALRPEARLAHHELHNLRHHLAQQTCPMLQELKRSAAERRCALRAIRGLARDREEALDLRRHPAGRGCRHAAEGRCWAIQPPAGALARERAPGRALVRALAARDGLVSGGATSRCLRGAACAWLSARSRVLMGGKFVKP